MTLVSANCDLSLNRPGMESSIATDGTSGLCPVEPNSRYTEVYNMYRRNILNGNIPEALQNCKRMAKLSKYTCYPTSWFCCSLILASGAQERLGATDQAVVDAKEALNIAPTQALVANW